LITHEPQPKKRLSLRQQRREALPRVAFTVSEWATITSMSKATVYRQMLAGELRFVQLRGTRRVPASELTRLGFSGAATTS
jgi:excisionase family DNA binding protein